MDQQDLNHSIVTGKNQMAELIQNFDWINTALGNPYYWSQSLKTSLSICLNSNFPIAIYWGKDLTLLYNDAWSPIPGNKHPWALGKPAREVWSDIWSDIAPEFEKAFQGIPGGSKDALLPMQRHGYIEECYFDFTFTPVVGENGKVEGVFNAVIETTYRVFNERNAALMNGLSARIAGATTTAEMFENIQQFMIDHRITFPFVTVYRQLGDDIFNPLSGNGSPVAPVLRNPKYTLGVYASEKINTISRDIDQVFHDLPNGYWGDNIHEAVILPFTISGNEKYFLLAGLNSRRPFNDHMKAFLETLTTVISNRANDILSLEAERTRAAALEEMDRAKTIFFSNISHEFRTPLTLILGNLEEVLNNDKLDQSQQQQLKLTQRNALRLLKLVNSLLDFGRLESGKQKPYLQVVDLAAYTKSLALNFKPIIEKGSLDFHIIIPDQTTLVSLDVQMWQKIVFNLLSNAFKYTLEGNITLKVETIHNTAKLVIEDSGVGIPAEEIPLLFDRFHRVKNSAGRSFEGTGIGLSLVKELIELQNGQIIIESALGKGTTVTVTLPAQTSNGTPQIPVIISESDELISSVFIEEALYLSDNNLVNEVLQTNENNNDLVLIVDDNADMRKHMSNIIAKKYRVITAADGHDALNKVTQFSPSLILSDIMMPVMDGITMIKRLRENVITASIPVLLITARAGEESRLEGFDTGADDYLVKPFSSKELLIRIESQIKIAQRRNNALNNIYSLFNDVPFAVAVLKGPQLIIEFANKYILGLWGFTKEQAFNKPMFELLPETVPAAGPVHAEVYRTGKRFQKNEIAVQLATNGKVATRYFNSVIDPIIDEAGVISGQLVTTIEVTEQVSARKKIEESEKELQRIFRQAPITITVYKGEDFVVEVANTLSLEMWGKTEQEVLGRKIFDISPELRHSQEPILRNIMATGEPFIGNEFYVTYNKNGKPHSGYFNFVYQPAKNELNEVIGIIAIGTEVTEAVKSRKELEESRERFRTLAETLPQMVWVTDAGGQNEYYSERWKEYSGQSNLDDAWEYMVHPEDKIKADIEYREAFKGNKPFRTELRVRNALGEYRWHSSVASPVKDENNKVLRWVGALTDIHDQKAYMEELEQVVRKRTAELENSNHELALSREHFLQLFKVSPVAKLLIRIRDHMIIDVNPAWVKIFDIGQEQIIEQHAELAGFTKKFFEREKNSHLDEEKEHPVEYSYTQKDGSPLIVLLSTARMTINQVEYLLVAMVDITARKLAEEKIIATANELEKKNKELESFNYVASHDLQEPLRKIRVFSDFVIENPTSPDLPKYLSKIDNAATRMSDLINAVLMYSKLSNKEEQFSKVDLNKILDNVKNDLELRIKETGAVISSNELPVIYSDSLQMEQLFSNLISNAIKFCKDQPSIKILFSRNAKGINSKIKKTYFSLSFSDNGIGIDPEYADRIFEMFQRLHGRRDYAGTGIGLSIVKKIIEHHGGEIKVTPNEHKGTSFIIMLPQKLLVE